MKMIMLNVPQRLSDARGWPDVLLDRTANCSAIHKPSTRRGGNTVQRPLTKVIFSSSTSTCETAHGSATTTSHRAWATSSKQSNAAGPTTGAGTPFKAGRTPGTSEAKTTADPSTSKGLH